MSDDRLLTAAEVADRLAVPETWVREHTRSGKIPHVELGRYRRYELGAVLAWLDQCQQGGQPAKLRKHAPKALP